MRNRKYHSVASPEDHAPAHRRPGVWSSWEVTLWSKILRRGGDGEEHANNMEKWQDGRLLRHLGGSCGLRARLLRCLDGSEQQRRDPHTSRAQRARGRCAIVHLFTSGGLCLSSLGGATLMTHVKFGVIAKLIWCTRGPVDGAGGRGRWTGLVDGPQAAHKSRNF